MWCHLNKPFSMQQFVGIFSLLTSQTAALDCETMKKTNEFPSPKVYSETDVIMKGQNVSLFCSNRNKSLQITYVMFRGMKHLGTWDGKGEPMIFNLRISEAGDLGPYKCKTQVSNCSRYSQEFSFTFASRDSCPFCLQLLLPGLLLLLIVIILMLAFWILPKYKARKAMRDNAPRNYGNKPMEVGIYANVCQNQADDKSVPGLEPRQCVSTAQDGTGHSQEIHYATPVFQEVAQGDHGEQ
uniref:Mast cell immunoglobulin like receptor 1 n=1 Tax=Equus asinus TaxID=9793 RepID=A0A9L0KA71_EQUAS